MFLSMFFLSLQQRETTIRSITINKFERIYGATNDVFGGDEDKGDTAKPPLKTKPTRYNDEADKI